MTSCPELNEIISLTEEPECRESAELAKHIYGCEDCQALLGVCLDAQEVSSLPEITACDEQQARKLVGEVLDRVSGWHRFQTVMTRWLSSGVDALLDFGASFFQEPQEALQPAFAASLHDNSRQDDLPVFEFFAEISSDPMHSWKASLTMPPVMMEAAELVFIVMDGRQRPIVSGELIFQGVALPVLNGVARMSVDEFRSSMTGQHTVQMRFSDGVCVDGDIRLMDA